MEKILRFLIIFLGTYLLLTLFFPPSDSSENIESRDDIEIAFADDTPTIGDLIEITLTNNTDKPLDLGTGTPPEKLFIEKRSNGEMQRLQISEEGSTIIPAKNSQTFSFEDQNTTFFSETKQYEVRVEHEEKIFTREFTLEKPGFFKTIWRTFFYKPIYNGLIGSLELTAFNLGLGIILFTIIVKLVLFLPTHNGMKAQRKLQKVQPELDKIRTKHSGNQQKIAMETMEVWKREKINPFSSILPILLQFPVLIALFYVIQNGLHPDKSFYLYSFLEGFDYHAIETMFLGFMPLLETPWKVLSMAWLPILIGVVQYFAMKITFSRMKKNPNKPKGTGFMAEFQQEFQKMNKVFIYVLPAMITIFSFIMPAAVGLYWLISTLFSIGQQLMVNKEIDTSK